MADHKDRRSGQASKIFVDPIRGSRTNLPRDATKAARPRTNSIAALSRARLPAAGIR